MNISFSTAFGGNLDLVFSLLKDIINNKICMIDTSYPKKKKKQATFLFSLLLLIDYSGYVCRKMIAQIDGNNIFFSFPFLPSSDFTSC